MHFAPPPPPIVFDEGQLYLYQEEIGNNGYVKWGRQGALWS